MNTIGTIDILITSIYNVLQCLTFWWHGYFLTYKFITFSYINVFLGNTTFWHNRVHDYKKLVKEEKTTTTKNKWWRGCPHSILVQDWKRVVLDMNDTVMKELILNIRVSFDESYQDNKNVHCIALVFTHPFGNFAIKRIWQRTTWAS